MNEKSEEIKLTWREQRIWQTFLKFWKLTSKEFGPLAMYSRVQIALELTSLALGVSYGRAKRKFYS